ncbi:OB-fold protein [Altererythrobacter fulvus]|uniref:OB-fold protein n=1 Tax=Caenibius fulvus TaxID=2126012 RepID=UPI0030181FB1
MTGEAAQPKKKMGCLKIGLIIVGAFILLGIVGSMVGGDGSSTSGGSSSGDSAAPANAEPPTEVTAQELFKAYEANEAAAQQQYGDRPLLVSGTIERIDLDFMDKPVVVLRTSNEFQSAQASLTEDSQPKAASLSKGQHVKLLCQDVSEVVGSPMLADCDIQ